MKSSFRLIDDAKFTPTAAGDDQVSIRFSPEMLSFMERLFASKPSDLEKRIVAYLQTIGQYAPWEKH